MWSGAQPPKKMVEAMDANVAKLLAALDRMGMRENTIVVFTSDNGGERFSETWPFVGVKGELLEGGIRVPLVASWPAHMQTGAVCDTPSLTMDWSATFLDAAGVSADATPIGTPQIAYYLGPSRKLNPKCTTCEGGMADLRKIKD